MTDKGVMLGTVITDTGKEIEVSLHGTSRELARVAALLGLEPDPDQAKAVYAGTNGGTPLALFNPNGSAVILRPTHDVSKLLEDVGI